MNTFTLKDFQTKAKKRFEYIFNGLEYVETLQKLSENPISPSYQKDASSSEFSIQIDAPTGSGKTVLLGHIAKDNFENFIHIVLSPGAGNLEEQTAKRLATILGETNVSLIDETTFGQPAATGITYVGNWEQFVSRDSKTGEYKNRTVREGEIRNFFDWVSEIGSKFLPVVITIDEAHYGSGKAISSITKFLDDIKDKLGYSPLYLELSATHIIDANSKVKIDLSDVIKEGLIRKTVRLNGADLIKKIDKLSPEQRASYQVEPFLLDFALEKQQQLDEEYIKMDAHKMVDGKKVFYHSLIGIQMPNGALGNEAMARVEARLRDEHGITRENGLLAVFLSNDKTANMKDIESPNSAVRVLIYKQGVATGWDCPRAHILVGYRHITSKIFTKQNLGRFLRTTQGEHYGNELLDSAYVISNVGDLGQASFGDDVDLTIKYEKEAIFIVDENNHVALSSFNDKKIPQSHYAFSKQGIVNPAELKKQWNKAANSLKLWQALDYSYVGSSTEGIISGSSSVENISSHGSYQLEETSKKIGMNDQEQLRNFELMILEEITKNDRTYGNNSQLSLALRRTIINWYREAVLKETHDTNVHFNKLHSVLTHVDAEKDEGLRFGEHNWYDIAVEQLSLDKTHWNSVSQAIQETLKTIKSVRIVEDEEYKNDGVPWSERTLKDDGIFNININQTLWINAVEDNKVNSSLEKYYATRMVAENASYKEGPAASTPEANFESKALMSLVNLDGTRLATFYKSPENKTNSFRIGVKTVDDKVSDFYPDYLGELLLSDNTYLPFIVEVKAEEDIKKNDGKKNSLFTAKVEALIKLSADFKIKAGFAFEESKTGSWFIITEVTAEGKYVVAPFKNYMLS